MKGVMLFQTYNSPLIFNQGLFLLLMSLQKGWVRYMHPEGAQYFCLQHALFMVYTDANLYTETILSKTDEFLQQVVEFISGHGHELHTVFDADTVDLVMDVTYSDQNLVCGYYFAHRPNQTIFWADDFPASRRLWADVKGVRSELHILHEMQAQYWEHCALFPCSRPPSQETVDQVRDILIHAISDTLMSDAFSPYSTSEMERMLAIIPPTVPSRGINLAGLSRTVYRILSVFARERFFHFHGEPAARLEFSMSVFSRPNSTTCIPVWFRFLSAVCFHTPHQHLKQIKYMFTDNLLNHPRCEQFIQKLVSEWTDLTLYSTVVLNANIAFLSVQTPLDSPIRIAIYVSTTASLGSITTGLLLLRTISKNVKDTLPLVQGDTGCMHLAILHSLPYVFLLWSLISFTLAFCLVGFLNTSNWTQAFASLLWIGLSVAALFYAAIVLRKIHF
ncbi:hypothetical protein BT96DRAFT_304191 [Gymnopus androsaceus JB14]|uniref:Uncharacterized protein n=1 Tax=Gymnopus androsaceus JB14 TaxID=1447944 RepID=A0A6A4GZX9_9AGAR|nr:hypothetical protein BT96DRAFT_304191 [Gymnopus androsaceus JB14]